MFSNNSRFITIPLEKFAEMRCPWFKFSYWRLTGLSEIVTTGHKHVPAWWTLGWSWVSIQKIETFQTNPVLKIYHKHWLLYFKFTQVKT